MKLEGGLVFDVHRQGSVITDVRLQSTRPLQTVSLLRGKSVSEGLALLGMMYRICGVAQRHAGLTAWQHATGVKAPEALQQAQTLLVNLETLREHLWQALVVWPKLLGDEPCQNDELKLLSTVLGETEQAFFKNGRGLTTTASLQVKDRQVDDVLYRLRLLIEKHVCGMCVAEWQKIESPAQLLGWAMHHHTPAARMIRDLLEQDWQSLGGYQTPISPLPLMTEETLEVLLSSELRENFIAQPTWEGACCETNTFTRQADHVLVKSVTDVYGSGLLARVVARLTELATLFVTINGIARELSGKTGKMVNAGDARSGQGVGIIEAARGRLIHWIKLEQGVIADYAVLAPTEWNFHPAGIAVQGLKTLAVRDENELQQQAALWINAIDPCVGYELRINS